MCTHTKHTNLIIMKKLFLLSIILYFSGLNMIHGQSFYGSDAQARIENAQEIHINESSKKIDYIAFRKDQKIKLSQLHLWISKQFNLADNFDLVELNRIDDQLGQTHIRYQMSIDQALVHDAMIVVHLQGDEIFAINGIIQTQANGNYQASISESSALNYALQHIDAKTYKWQMPKEEEFLKSLDQNPDATYFPAAEMEIIRNKITQNYRLSYKFNIYAHEPMSRSEIFVDAQNGDILFVNNQIHHSDSIGTAVTTYSSTKTITTDYYNTSYRLRESSRGLGIETYDLNTSTSYGSAVDFTDADNYWNNINAQQDEVATDAHWGMEMTYDYYFFKHNRNSIDGNGFKLRSYVHYDVSYANAFWNGQYMTFGDGNSSWDPLVSLDIVGHEISHGLTTNTADLDYQDESGAMNEAYSDIFGTAIEFYAKPATANWLMGEDIGSPMRSMSNPKSKGDPDTYLGQYYYIGTADNGGVHTNSGVLNHCFYLMSDGGSGTNDNNDVYSVNGLGIDTAGAIAFRALTVYLTNTSQYADARFYFIKSAIDLYGPCSLPVQTTTNAFYAVGIGNVYQAGVQADFTALITHFCQPTAQVGFTNLSNNGGSFTWYFGDGDSSNLYNPVHSYTNYGTFIVTLIADGGSCGIDTLIKTEYISIDTANPCQVYMPPSGTQTLTGCAGVLFDSGGPNNYGNNTNVSTTISPSGATKVTLNFVDFDFESGYDYLKIYDGQSASSPIIGSYDGSNLPNGGTVIANSGSVTLVQTSDVAVTKSGFIANWICEYATVPPISDFVVNDTSNCSGDVQFTDLSQNGPTTWAWDFGDGNTSNIKNPSHTYAQSGIYSVSLVATNSFGFNQISKSNYIHINKPSEPYAPSQAVCNSGSMTLTANGNGKILWFVNASTPNILDTGAVFTTPNLTQTTSYWVENHLEKPIQNVGKVAATPGGANLNYDQYLIFDVFKPVILKSVKVYAYSSGSRTIKLQNSSGSTLATKNFTVVIGWNTVTLDFDLPIGTDLRLAGKNLHRSNVGVSYPYALSGILSIHKSSAGTNPLSYYYYFYDWEIQEEACISNRLEVKAFVNQANPTADFSMSNNDPSVQFTDISTNAGQSTWNFGDQTSSQINNPVHTYLQNGTYQVKMTVDNGCGTDSITKTVSINLATSIFNQQDNEGIKLYPNPNHGTFILQIDGSQNYQQLIIYDILGNQVLIQDIDPMESNYTIDIQNFSAGMYLIQLSSTDKITNLRMIKN